MANAEKILSNSSKQLTKMNWWFPIMVSIFLISTCCALNIKIYRPRMVLWLSSNVVHALQNDKIIQIHCQITQFLIQCISMSIQIVFIRQGNRMSLNCGIQSLLFNMLHSALLGVFSHPWELLGEMHKYPICITSPYLMPNKSNCICLKY